MHIQFFTNLIYALYIEDQSFRQKHTAYNFIKTYAMYACMHVLEVLTVECIFPVSKPQENINYSHKE